MLPLTSCAQQVLYGVNQRLRVEDVDSPLCEIRPVKTVLLVVLTGDRGLCGGYNNFIIKKVRGCCLWFLKWPEVLQALRH
jgi:F-type H+-transporting ATPase subunit gamma